MPETNLKKNRAAVLFLLAAFCFCALLWAKTQSRGQAPARSAGKGIVVGLEYAILSNPRIVKSMAGAFAETGLTGMKHYAEAVQWSEMQKGPDQPIDFKTLDLFVREYQKQGFTELTLCLRPQSKWASKGEKWLLRHSSNPTPKPEYRGHFKKWIRAVVERYDGDGRDDMPGLRWPVRYVEIGSEFSSYEPEPVDDYLGTLSLAYRAAHEAYAGVKIGHAAFLVAPVDLDVKDPRDYEKVWAETKRGDTHHDLKDQRKILDHPGIFDFVNIHNLGAPYEIEAIRRWLDYEMGLRKYNKPVVISDTIPTSYIGWGPATICRGPRLGLLVSPAKEADRCRLAAYFYKMVRKDPAALAWTRGFVAADHVQRTIIAAEQGIALINLSFTGDIIHGTWKGFRAAAGISPWGGAAHFNFQTGQVYEKYPLFYAIRQMMGHIRDYESIERVLLPDDSARVYLVRSKGRRFWVAWRNPKAVLLPGDIQPASRIELKTGTAHAMVEEVITGIGQETPRSKRVAAPKGVLSIEITHTPVYIFPEK